MGSKNDSTGSQAPAATTVIPHAQPERWEVRNAAREIVEFYDTNDLPSVLLASSVPGTIWLGLEDGLRMHLDSARAEELRRLLGNWLESGSFESDE